MLNFDPISNQVTAVPLDDTSVAGRQPLGVNTVATVIDQTSGSLLFYSNGALIYDENHNAPPLAGLGGDETESQSVAISVRNFDLSSPYASDYFVFYVTASDELNYIIASFGTTGNLQVGQPNQLSLNVGKAIKVIDAAKPNVGNQSYLIYFDASAGELVASLVGSTGVGPPQIVAWPFPPEQIRFNEEKSQIFAIGPSGELRFINFDRVTGAYDPASLEVITFPPTSSGDINGITFNESGRFAYISRGNQIYQVDLDDPLLTAEPITLPPSSIDEVLDIKFAPNGKVYFMYRNVGSGEVKIGEIQSPDLLNSDPGFLVDMDPFPGIDFCGRMFPTFSTTVHFTPTVEIEAPVDTGTGFCANNPIQLISKITPSSMIPVSYEWSYGTTTGIQTSNVAHLILIGQGTAEVSLKVTFSNGVVAETLGPTQINLALEPPDVQLSPDPSDIICPCSDPRSPNPSAGEGVNLADWLTIDGSPASPSSGFEYYWSAFPERGWRNDPQANVCEPGTYYVMVRKSGEECYGYAEVEVRVVDNSNGDNLPTGRNGKWFFGNKAGIDFNDYPIFNPRPINAPRPLSDQSLNTIKPLFDPQTDHPQNIPNGVDVFYDVAGNVVFYTNGEKVWDYAHNEIPIDLTGLTATLGGDQNSNQGALIVPYPNPDQESIRTLFYIFTTQVNAPHEVKFTMLDLAQGTISPPQDNLGKIVSFDHLLFSRGTQQSAAYMDGASTFVAFKEMGSGRYRTYKIDEEGIHAPNLSGSGVLTPANSVIPGAMQFSFGGKYLASVYSFDESGSFKSVIELFEFDSSTGDLTLYATFSLDGLAHGIEVSFDEKRLFVSINNSVREFFIEQQNISTGITPPPFNACIGGALTVLERSNCIVASEFTISTGNNRAIQRGPLPAPFIWVAEEGSSTIGIINERTGVNQSQVIASFLPMSGGGEVRKGLPRYKVPALSGSLDDPAIFGPPEICLNVTFPARPPVTGSASYQFFITGEDIDVHSFVFIRNYEGVTSTVSGLVPVQNLVNFTDWEVNFTQPGEYTIVVTVQRCGFTFPPIELNVEVYAPPFILPDVINFCDDGSPLEIKALNDVFYDVNDYEIEWRRSDLAGNPIGAVLFSQNTVTFSDTINDIGQYIITVKHSNKIDPCEASTFVFIGPPRGLDLHIQNDTICLDDVLEAFPFVGGGSTGPFTPSGEVGDFRIFRTSNLTNPVYQLANVDRLSLAVRGLFDPGDYILEFETIDTLALSSSSPIAPKCLLMLSKPFTILPDPQVVYRVVSNTSCGLASGELELEAADPSDLIYFDGNPVPLSPADPANPLIYRVLGLAPGSYLVDLESGLTGCTGREFIVIPNANAGTAVPNFQLKTSPAICGPGGKAGSLSINAPADFTGSYQIKDSSGTTRATGGLGGVNPPVVALPAGDYIIDFFDSIDCFITSQVFEIENTFGSPLVFNQTFCFSLGDAYTISLPSFLDLLDPTISQFEWLDSSTGIATPAEISYAVASPGEYILTVDYGFCELELVFNIQEKCEIDYRVPDAVKVSATRTPVGSGKYRDDVVTLVTNNFIQEVEAFIYNRWGQLIHVKKYTPVISEPFHSEIIWDGVVNGEQVPLGTYVMVFVFTTVDNRLEKRTEPLFVIR